MFGVRAHHAACQPIISFTKEKEKYTKKFKRFHVLLTELIDAGCWIQKRLHPQRSLLKARRHQRCAWRTCHAKLHSSEKVSSGISIVSNTLVEACYQSISDIILFYSIMLVPSRQSMHANSSTALSVQGHMRTNRLQLQPAIASARIS